MIITILGKVHAKIEKKLLTSFLKKNCLKCKKGTILTFRLLKMTFRAIQQNPSYDMLLMSSQRSFMSKKEKRYRSVSEIGLPLLKVDADADADDDVDGQVSIWKAPLPLGTAELKKEERKR